MRNIRRSPVLAISLTAAGALSAPAAFATRSVWSKDGLPTCTVTITAPARSSTTCTGTMNGQNDVQFLVNLDASGVAVYRCEDSTGATMPGQNQVQVQGGSTTSFMPSKKDQTFITDPAVLAAAPALSASQAGCADGTVPIDPTLTTTKVQLWIATQGDAPLLFSCSVFHPDGLTGTVTLATC